MATKAPARPTELKVKVTSAKNLIAADSNGKSDPFAVVYTKSGSSGKDKSIKTKKIAETLAPVWNETFNLILRDRKDTLVVEVWDDDLFGKDHLGTAEIPLESLEHDKETPIVAKLNKQGEISVALTIRYNDKEIEEFQKQEEERKRIEAQKKKEEEDKKAALEAQKKKDEEEARKKKEEEDRKKKEEEDKKIALEAQKKKEEEEKKKKEDEAKKAQAAQPAQPAKATTAPAASPATTPATTPAPAQTPAKSTSAPAASPATAPAATKPAASATPATSSSSTTQTKSTTTPAKPATKQAESEGPNYVVIGGVVAVLAVAGFAAFKYFGKN